MASRTLYPPIVDSYMPAFVVGQSLDDYCRIYFSLSKFNGLDDFSNAHVSIIKQNTGMNVVDTTKDLHKTGIILNVTCNKVISESNLYYIDIYDSDLSSVSGDYKGWIPGWIYKIQLRLSNTAYDPNSGIGEAAWLNLNASSFSEWSTVCIVKAIGKIDYVLNELNIDTTELESGISTLNGQIIPGAFLNLTGSFINEIDPTELIYSYNFILFDENDNILEKSGDIYSNQFQSNNTINYSFKTELIDSETYRLAFKYTTINKYEGGFYRVDSAEGIDERFEWVCSTAAEGAHNPPCELATVENNTSGAITSDISTKEMEEDEGRVAVKFTSANDDLYSGNLCIRRSSSFDNFKTWIDVYVYVCKQENINAIPVFYDYTIESGVWYKYGVQTISSNGDRGKLISINHPVMRNFNYSFILGKNNQQLKLQFDNTINNFKYQVGESKVDPIGSQYSNIARNAVTYYKTFPITGLISFWMDENELFCSKMDLYKYEYIKDLYDEYNKNNHIIQYDYIYEKQFREMVLDFLYDGEYKILKSPTEGNLIVRLMDINCMPNQALDRMIYSFSANVHEIAKANIENYIKYGFLVVAPYDTSFAISRTRLGQIQMEIPTVSKTEALNDKGDANRVITDIISEIIKKYDSGTQNIGGFSQKIVSIHHLKIHFDDKPIRIALHENNSRIQEYGVGYQIYVKGANIQREGQIFKIFSPVQDFDFDERLIHTPLDKIYILQDDEEDGKVPYCKKMAITVDFLYDITSDDYNNKQIQLQQVRKGIAQIFTECYSNTDLYKEISYKYRIETNKQFQRLIALTSIEIEANPGAVFAIRDTFDGKRDGYHEIGITGILRLYEIENIVSIRYLGMKDPTTGEIKKEKTDVLMNYHYLLQKGTYKE